MKIRLDEWLERMFDPPPVKIGRSYYVEKNATYPAAQDGAQ